MVLSLIECADKTTLWGYYCNKTSCLPHLKFYTISGFMETQLLCLRLTSYRNIHYGMPVFLSTSSSCFQIVPLLGHNVSRLSADITRSSKVFSKGTQRNRKRKKKREKHNLLITGSRLFVGGRRSRTPVRALIPHCVPFSIFLLYLELYLNPIMPLPSPTPLPFKTKQHKNRTKTKGHSVHSTAAAYHCDATCVPV